jgi:hypothetical protein
MTIQFIPKATPNYQVKGRLQFDHQLGWRVNENKTTVKCLKTNTVVPNFEKASVLSKIYPQELQLNN